MNIGNNSIFPGSPQTRSPGIRGRPQRLARVIRAISPDVVCIQEVFRPYNAASVVALLDSILPLQGGAHWTAHQVHDNVIASRYPITGRAGSMADHGAGVPRGEAIASIAVESKGTTHSLVVTCTHFQSAGGEQNIAARQQHADHITRWLQSSLPSVGAPAIPDSAALVVLGDFNAYDTDPARHIETLLAGFPSTEPKSRNSPLLSDARPLHNARGPDFYTWRSDTQRFNPGALDRILFNARKLELNHAFTLYTRSMTPAELERAGLSSEDVMLDIVERVQDHLPVVADFRFR
jgi:endonuclease/exonuclease/phosphatase family metal-dependent hydrolase